jgi:dTDP-4-amino-4,6-dideoxygalactose transaminase
MKPFSKPIYVTRPLLPSREAVYRKIDEIFDSQWLTNNGPQHKLFEKALVNYLQVPQLSLVNNGTSALQLACQALRLSGEVITTPFTFAATPHVLYWNNIKPVFCDIEENSWNINADKIESLITPSTSAILPVHVFGNPCNIERIQKIAERYGLKVIYDASHCFGIKINGQGIGNFGDISTFSFHATKIFHTFEGGALTCNDPTIKMRVDLAKNFGFQGENSVIVPGINAKMNEFQAAVGLLVLNLIETEVEKRKKLTRLYQDRLNEIKGITFLDKVDQKVDYNYYNFVIRVDKDKYGKCRDELYEELKKYNVFARKYFYPLCSQFQCYKNYPSSSPKNLPIAEKVSEEVLSLPLYGSLAEEEVNKICDIIALLGDVK